MPSKRNNDSIENLTKVAESLNKAVKYLRHVIKSKSEIDKLDLIEEPFQTLQESFQEFERMTLEHYKKGDELLDRAHQDISKQLETREDLNQQIVELKRSFEEQNSQNAKLEYELKAQVAELQKLRSHKNGTEQNDIITYANAVPLISSPSSFIHRLCDESELK